MGAIILTIGLALSNIIDSCYKGGWVVQLGITTHEAIGKRSALFKGLCIPAYFVYVIVCVYAVNGARGYYRRRFSSCGKYGQND